MALPPNFSFVRPERLAGMGRPPMAGPPLVDALIDLARVGITAVVSLTETAPDSAPFKKAGFLHRHVPISDFRAPSLNQIREVVQFTRGAWAQKRGVAVHCAAGIGRTGTLLAALLMADEHLSAADAIAEVRRLRPYSIESKTQEDVLFQFGQAETK